jgi:hypothetical protein
MSHAQVAIGSKTTCIGMGLHFVAQELLPNAKLKIEIIKTLDAFKVKWSNRRV